MTIVPLAELVRPAGNKAGGETDLPVYSVTKHAGFVPSLEYFKKQVFSRDVAGYKVVEPGDFAYATIHLDEGSIGIAPARGLISPMYTVFRTDDSRVDPAFLIRYLKSPRALALYPQLGKGAVHRRKAISLAALGNLPVLLPPLPEQRRIAAILDHADTLRAKRRQVLAHLDSLTQSIFNDMFADVLERTRLKDMGVDFISGKNVLGDDMDAHPVNRVIKVSAISGGTFIPSESKPMPRDYSPPETHRLRSGDILFGRASGSLELLGATAVVDDAPDDYFLPDKVWRLTTTASGPVTKGFILGVLRSADARAFIRHTASGAAGVRNIGKAKLLEYEAPLPRIDRQLDFAERIEKIDRERAALQRALSADDELFNSLQSRAFRGEL
ncbi:restriction endonuclease subunit S domain-containing protein [Nocardioides jensenii]|uniref:restriction endonuclease subunit S n=1 Tax=Nocardioides jensenii TaxID=1843 RepID=UPI0008319C7B|nr:restriction endonuclease subunit S [Nocardioides jensenii]